MVEHVCRSPARVVVVAGKAGTGKTFALAAAREAWQQAGHPVLGVAVARRAARELTAGAGIEATSTAALVHDVHNGRPLPKGCVLVVDEAGMVATRQLAELLEHVERADGKLVPSAITPAARDRGRRRVPRLGRPRARGRAGSQPAPGGSVERRALDHVADGRAAEAVAASSTAASTPPPPPPDPNPARRRLVERADR